MTHVHSHVSGSSAGLRPLSELRVGFVSPAHAWAGDAVYTNASLKRLISELARRSAHLEVALPMEPHRANWLTDVLPEASKTFSFRPMPRIASFAAGFRRGGACRRILRDMERHCDVLYVQLPFSPPQALLRPNTPRVYQVCADFVGVARASSYYRGLKRFAAVGVALAVDRLQLRLIRHERARVVTNGRELYEHYGRPAGRPIVSATLLQSELDSVSRRRADDGRQRILFVGYLRPEKGLDSLLEAFRMIRRELPTAELHIVGEQDLTAGNAVEVLRKGLANEGLGAAMHLHGSIPFGPQLFQTFADADVLLLPSHSGEGTPRVLIEARAFGCPVVATSVGGVASSVEDEVDGLLVPPNDPGRLAAATLRVLRDSELRSRLVETGRARMRERTMERFVDIIEQELVTAAAL